MKGLSWENQQKINQLIQLQVSEKEKTSLIEEMQAEKQELNRLIIEKDSHHSHL